MGVHVRRGGNDGLIVIETYVVEPPLPGGQSPFTYYGSEWVEDPDWERSTVKVNAK